MLAGSQLPRLMAGFVCFSFVGLFAVPAFSQSPVSGDFSGQFDVTASGEASYAIPVSVVPGIGDLIPEVELYYSSGSGNGLLGVGWGIGGLSAMTRCSQSLTPDGTIRAVQFDDDDRFCLDGQRLVSVSGDYGTDGTEYRTEIDGHARIVSTGTAGSGPEQFTVHTAGGHVLSYGQSADSRIETVAPAGTAGSEVKYWLLSQVEDRLGNVITYRYAEDQTTGGYRISEIGYGGGAAGSEAARVAFDYEARPDVRSSYQGGSLASLDQRLTSIRTLSDGTLITSYNMSYLPHEGADAVDMSILSSIEVCDGAGNCRLPLDVSWTTLSSGYERSDVSNWMGLDPSRWAATDYVLHVLDHNGDGRDDWLFQARSSSAASYILTGSAAGYILKDVTDTSSTNADYWRADRRKIHILDFNGDGRSDVLLQSQTTSQASYLLTGGEEGFDDIVGLSGTYWAQDESALSVVDHNGDGRSDVLLQGKTTAKSSYLALGGTDGLGDLEDISSLSGMSKTHWSADKRKLHVIDYDGDGLSDLLLQGSSGQSSYLLRADRSQEDETTGIGFGPVETVDSLWGMSQGAWASNYYELHVVDHNGDGLSDLLLQGTSGSYGTSLLLGHGSGFVAAQVLDTSSGMSRSLWASNNHRLIAYDFNGDGLGDVLLQGKSSGQASYLLRSTSSGFDDKLAIDSLWGMSQSDWRADKHVVHVTDAGGDSTADLVLQAVNVSDKSYLLSSDGEGYPLVTALETGRGEKTQISYLPLHDDGVYERGEAVNYPEQQYESGTKVVSSLKHDDGLGGVRTLSYEYSGARIDIERRRFLGFSSVLSKDEDAGTQTLTEYRQDVPYLQRIARKERRLSDGRLIEERVNSWQAQEVQAGTATSPSITDVRLSQAVSKSYEIEGQAIPDDGTDPTDPVLPTYEIVISSHATNYGVAAALQADGVWNGTDAVEVTVTVDEGVVIGSNSASAYALDFTGLPEGSTATLTNNGSIVGYYGTANGGNGGHAVKTDIPLLVANYGVIYAGGGGGVNGSARSATGTRYQSYAEECHSSPDSCNASGGSGGRGAGWYGSGLVHQAAVTGGAGATCVAGTDGGYQECTGRDGRAYATGNTGGSGGAFGSKANSGGASGVAFNAYRLVSFVHAGLWSGRVIDDASPGEDETPTDPVEDADYLLTISSHVQNYSVLTELSAAGWDGVTPTSVKVVVEDDVVVGGASVSGYALSLTGLPEGSTAILVNRGDIIGRYGAPNGGTGGNAVSTGVSLRLYNFGRIYAGGGAGAKGANRTAHGINYVSSGEQCNGNRVSCVASGGSGGRGAGWYALGNIYETGSSGASGSTCTAGGGNVTGECSGRSGAVSATGSTGTSGGGLGFEADVGGNAGYAFTGFNRIDFVVPGEWGGRVASN